MKISTEPFRPEDLAEISFSPTTVRDVHDRPLDDLARLYASSPAVTLRDSDGQIIACMGLLSLWSGVSEAWVVTSPLAVRYPVLLYRTVNKYLWSTIRSLGLRRVQAVVRKDFYTGHAFLQSLGFRPEGLMPRYGNGGADCVRYALLPEE